MAKALSVLLCCLLVAVSARAQSWKADPSEQHSRRRAPDDDARSTTGWYAGGGASAVQVSGNDLLVAVPVSPGTGSGSGDAITLDYGISPAYSGFIGYRTDENAFEASYWTYRQTAAVAAAASGETLSVNFGDPNRSNSIFNIVSAHSHLYSDQVDLAWIRNIYTKDKARLDWRLGLRGWNLRETIDSQGINTIGVLGNAGTDTNHVDSYSYGAGLAAGVSSVVRLLDWLTLSAAGDFGFLMGRAVAHDDDFFLGPGDTSSMNTTVHARRNFEQMGLTAKLRADIFAGLTGSLGYEFKYFGGAHTAVGVACLNGCTPLSGDTTVRDMSFAGPSAELSYQF